MSQPSTNTKSTPNQNGNKTIAVPSGPPAPAQGEMVRQEFGAIVTDAKAETAANVLAAQASAAVQARFVMALQRPRDIDVARVKILKACQRPLFAKGAIYKKPMGKKFNEETKKWEPVHIEGLSIRFAEEAIRALGNAMTDSQIVYDDRQRRIIRVSVTDFESNVVHFKDINVDKTVERTKLKTDQLAISRRINSYGEPVFIVEATDDEMLVKSGALAAKAMRDKILMLLPSDIQEEARILIKKVQATEDAKDPEAARKLLIDSFASLGVLPNHLAEYMGHEINVLTPAELQHLRAIFSAIKDGEATWAEVVEENRDFDKEFAAKDAAKSGATGGAAAPAAAKGKANVNDLAAQAKAKREGKDAKPEDKAADKPAEDKGDAREVEDRGDDPLLDRKK